MKYRDICGTEFSFCDIASYKTNNNAIYNFESEGRVKNLLFYQMENMREYYIKDEHICTLHPGDILFLPHGAKYRSFLSDGNLPSDGIGISFNLLDINGEPIYIDEDIRLITKDRNGRYYKHFQKILYSAMNQTRDLLKLKGSLYILLDELFSNMEKTNERFDDISSAISILENEPKRNLTLSELAQLCHMSESTFMRRFKSFSGGISPIKYRNNIRLMLADELATSSMTISEIAEELGFYDAAHLCKIYKKEKGCTLKCPLKSTIFIAKTGLSHSDSP